MRTEYKVFTLKDDFKPRIITNQAEPYESDTGYYIKQGLALFALFICLFLLILDFEWMAGKL